MSQNIFAYGATLRRRATEQLEEFFQLLDSFSSINKALSCILVSFIIYTISWLRNQKSGKERGKW